MFGLQMIDVVLGLVFVYLLLSIVCTAANELLASLFKLRAKTLATGITNLLKDGGITGLERDFYEHPLIKSLYKQRGKPSYIPPRTFAMALLNLIAPENTAGLDVLSNIRAKVENLPDGSDLRKTLLILIDDAGDSLEKLRGNVEKWFNDSMDRVSGWYKRKAQFVILILAITVTVLANADTIQIAKALSIDPALRENLVTQAQGFLEKQAAAQPNQAAKPNNVGEVSSGEDSDSATLTVRGASSDSPSKRIQNALQEVQQTTLPLGWKSRPEGREWINKIIGLLLTALAASMGAPFWFDKLQKVANIRAAGASPRDSHQT
jgi:hypothetical protein